MRRLTVLVLVAAGCVAPQRAAPPADATPPDPYAVPASPALGISGMAPAGDGAFLAVHDAKSFEDGPRLSLLTVDASGVALRPLPVADWRHPEGRSSDLEGACALGDGTFLVAESGTFEGRYGRMFHVRPGVSGVEVLAAVRLPFARDNTPGADGDNLEGLACVRDGAAVLVLLGERGASEAYPVGLIRWVRFDPATGTLDVADAGRGGVPVSAPGDLVARGFRSITGLHVTPDGSVWSAASRDPGDLGPFDSVVYRLGRVDATATVPVTVEPGGAACAVSGFKVEAVSAPALGGTVSLGTEDEAFGGTWRPLVCEPTPPRP